MCMCLCVYSVCKYAHTQLLLCYNGRVRWSELEDVVQPCWFEERGVEGGNRQRASKSYKHWSSQCSSGAGLEEQLLNIQRQKYRDQARTEMKQQATFLRPSHIIHSHIKDGTGLQSWSFQKGVCIILAYLCVFVCIVCKRARECMCELEAERVSVGVQ